MKKVKLSDDEKYLIDFDGIRFKRSKPLSTIEVKVSTAYSQPIRIDTKKNFVDAIKDFPKANAFLDLGPIPEKRTTEKIEHTNPDAPSSIVSYEFYKIELYHLGE